MDLESTVTDAVDDAAPGGEVIVYEESDGDVRVDVRFDRETAWLTQRQISEVFGTTSRNVQMHLRNVFSSGELEAGATTKDFLVVRAEGDRTVRRRLKHYNLDAIISVGYRVNSKRGVRFRQWATRTLREHLIHGYTLNERRLAERGLREARDTLDLLSRTLKNQVLVTDTGRAVLDVIGQYADTWRLLVEYDEDRLRMPPGRSPSTGVLDFDTATGAIIRFAALPALPEAGERRARAEPAGGHGAHAAHRRERPRGQGSDGASHHEPPAWRRECHGAGVATRGPPVRGTRSSWRRTPRGVRAAGNASCAG
ncbi:virulence RhuM family protein [Candidatus Palauibacter sp.]|uniref:virulence RhuM family protein n=1 Tax=Candidatus Palauibacter sp. TaxID=3101350 RepID=UPI003B01D6F2